MRRKAIEVPTEWEEQCAVISWAELMVSTGQEPLLRFLVGSASGARLTMGNLMKLKRAGVIKKAWPDLFLAVAVETYHRDLFHGLFIELKRRKGGTVSPEQAIMIGDLQSLGYKAIVCKGADHAITEIKRYLG